MVMLLVPVLLGVGLGWITARRTRFNRTTVTLSTCVAIGAISGLVSSHDPQSPLNRVSMAFLAFAISDLVIGSFRKYLTQ